MSESYVAIQVVMMPKDTNPHGTIFGGVILSYIDQAGAIGAIREVLKAGGPVPMLVTVAGIAKLPDFPPGIWMSVVWALSNNTPSTLL